jgi:hypothetical protein
MARSATIGLTIKLIGEDGTKNNYERQSESKIECNVVLGVFFFHAWFTYRYFNECNARKNHQAARESRLCKRRYKIRAK